MKLLQISKKGIIICWTFFSDLAGDRKLHLSYVLALILAGTETSNIALQLFQKFTVMYIVGLLSKCKIRCHFSEFRAGLSWSKITTSGYYSSGRRRKFLPYESCHTGGKPPTMFRREESQSRTSLSILIKQARLHLLEIASFHKFSRILFVYIIFDTF